MLTYGQAGLLGILHSVMTIAIMAVAYRWLWRGSSPDTQLIPWLAVLIISGAILGVSIRWVGGTL